MTIPSAPLLPMQIAGVDATPASAAPATPPPPPPLPGATPLLLGSA